MNNFSANVKAARRGDAEAFARLYQAVYKDLYRIALCSLRNSHDACDAVSDTVMDAFCSIGRLRDEKAFRGWIMQILAAKIKRKQQDYYNIPSDIEESLNEGEDFDYLSFEVREALENLDSESRLILSMSVLCGYTSEEIARICGIKAGTVRSRLARIRQLLRVRLGEE